MPAATGIARRNLCVRWLSHVLDSRSETAPDFRRAVPRPRGPSCADAGAGTGFRAAVLRPIVRLAQGIRPAQGLEDLIGRAIKCTQTCALAAKIIDGSNAQEEAVAYFPADDLFTPFDRRRGLPIGNQTSQFFANVYLNPLDHFVLRELRPGLYLRYVDDFVLFGDDKRELWDMAKRIREFLEGFRLAPHPRKFGVFCCAEGLTFLGWRLLPGQTRLARPNVIRMRRRLRKISALYHGGRVGFQDVHCRVQSWLGHVHRTSASRSVTGTSQRTRTTTSGSVAPVWGAPTPLPGRGSRREWLAKGLRQTTTHPGFLVAVRRTSARNATLRDKLYPCWHWYISLFFGRWKFPRISPRKAFRRSRPR